MKQYVTIDKRSKKVRKEYYSKQCRTWGKLNPVTRSVSSGKTYNRNRDKQEKRRIGKEFSNGFDVDFCVLVIESCKYLKMIYEKIVYKIKIQDIIKVKRYISNL